MFEGEKYDDKEFLVKNFPLHAVSADGIKPTINELDKFEETIDGPESNVSINKRKISKNDLLPFAPGDQVELCEEGLINLQGTIFGIDGDSIRILPKHKALNHHSTQNAHKPLCKPIFGGSKDVGPKSKVSGKPL